MKILYLINTGKNFDHFFSNLHNEIVKHGNYECCFAFDSSYTFDKSKHLQISNEPYIFSDFFSTSAFDEDVLSRYKEFNLNNAIFADFERANEYGILKNIDRKYYTNLQKSLLSFFEFILSSENIDAVICESISNAFTYFCYYVCLKHKVRFEPLSYSRLPGHFIIGDHDNLNFKCNLKRILNKQLIVSGYSKEYVDNYFNKFENVEPDYMNSNGLRNLSLSKKYINSSILRDLFFAVKFQSKVTYYFHEIGNPLILYRNLFFRNVSRLIKSKLIKSYYENPNFDRDYLIYPLHFHPEASTSLYASAFVNEFEVIRHIAFNLPVGVALYVKDHQSAWGYPSLSFYRKLRKLPNVFLITPFCNTKDLIRHSKGVVTLTSTMGFEALLMGKRVFLLGDVFYSIHKNVIKIRDYLNLHEVLFDKMREDSILDVEYNKKFVAAYFESGFLGELNLSLKNQESQLSVRKLGEIIHTYLQRQ
jgi:hypothetical protein